MTAKPRTITVPMVEHEITEIEDYRFGNRISSRSEAIRRLIEMGLSVSKQGADATQN